ncbi:hypothetical protein GCM10027053_16670 [Intrasporangium mesophilum]
MTATGRQFAVTPDREVAAILAGLDRFRRVAEQHARLGAADQRLMWLFSDGQPRTLREISEALRLEQSTVNRQVNAALKAGLLRRGRAAGHAAREITATAEGLAQFEQDLTLMLGLYQDALGSLQPDDQEQLLRLLGVFAEGYAAAVARRPWSRPSEPIAIGVRA